MHKKLIINDFLCLNYGTICESSIDNQEKNKHKPPIDIRLTTPKGALFQAV